MISGVRDTGIERFGLESKRFTVLVMGGSQGSSGINKIASEAAGILNEKRPGKFQFIHLTGTRDLDEVKKFYKERAIKACVFSFLEKMELAYACSDFAVSRSGAAAIFELAFYSIPMILVPYPNARNNQRTNAVYFSQKGAALYREEHELTAEKLARDVSEMFSDDAKRRELSQRSNALAKPDAGTCLADEVIKLVKTRG
jgi:UDP-N-acetylglucosamine--N-acetylmuramyl-(pentapeptide) pyrophosphoryl-undecaprenol N-acetylglucosamine transferase